MSWRRRHEREVSSTFLAAEWESVDHIKAVIRVYDSSLLASIFRPAGRIKEFLAEHEVLIQAKSEFHPRGGP